MIIAGLTGSIATGKSTVSGFFKDAGAVIVDADQVAHDVVKKDLPAWHGIVKYFGREILLPDGEIDRDALGDIIFKNSDQKKALNRIVHPFVFEEMGVKINKAAESYPDSVIILDVPLLIEGGMHMDMSDIILVYTPETIQLERLMARNNLCEEDAMARIRSQMSIEEKKKIADIIIDNSSTLEKTREQTLEVFQYLLNKAG